MEVVWLLAGGGVHHETRVFVCAPFDLRVPRYEFVEQECGACRDGRTPEIFTVWCAMGHIMGRDTNTVGP